MSTVAEMLNHPDMHAVLLAAGWLPPDRVKEVDTLLARLNSGLVSTHRSKPSKGVLISMALTGAALRTLHGNAQGLQPKQVVQAAFAKDAKRKADRKVG